MTAGWKDCGRWHTDTSMPCGINGGVHVTWVTTPTQADQDRLQGQSWTIVPGEA